MDSALSQQAAQPIQRLRASKKRRIRCDETRPSCGACTRSGWKCEGYPTTEKRLTVPTSNVALNISTYCIPFRIPGSKMDRQVMHYFCTQAACDLSGFVHSDFWLKTVLQASCHEPTVRQALLALSSLHLDYVSSNPLSSCIASTSTLRQYGLALKRLQQRITKPSPEAVRVALLCSILFFSFESILGNSNSALQQLNGGLDLLRSVQIESQSKIAEPECIEDMFARLDIQATIFDDEKVPKLTLVSRRQQDHKATGPLATPFGNLQDAQRELVTLQNWMWHFLISNNPYKFLSGESLPTSLMSEKAQLEEEMQQWSTRFTASTVTHQDMNSSLTCGASVLLIQYSISHMLLSSNFPNNDAVFRASPNPHAERVLELAESVLEHIQRRDRDWKTVQSPRRSFSAELGIVAPLTLLTIKCADPAVINRATRVLIQVQRQESLYDTTSLLSMMQHLRKSRETDQFGISEGDVQVPLEHSLVNVLDRTPAELKSGHHLIPLSILSA
ncbi:fungal specific transcription factor domain-containing protein [Sarocladium implicatum]|nr:fungal specific transcription factor domain-containing protein [Sarocladium implicatum]